MNYKQTFHEVAEFLANQGISVDIADGDHLSSNQLDELQDELKITLPSELKKYLSDVGDGFSLQYSFDDDFISAGLDHSEDWIDERESLLEKIEAIIGGSGDEYGYESITDADISIAKQRMSWLPIYGVGLGGSVFFLDTKSPTKSISLLETSYDILTPTQKVFTLSHGIEQLISRWSRFCFSDPSSIHFSTYACNKSGLFEWDPELFDTRLHR